MSASEMKTSVPSLNLTDRGFEAPRESEILAGIQSDLNAALGGAANMALDTPQGQIATTLSAIIADCHDQLISLLNGIDPFLASGQMQDSIGALYAMSRQPAAASRVEATLTGTPNFKVARSTPIATDGTHTYSSNDDVFLSSSGSATAWLTCDEMGVASCPPSTLRLYKNVSGLLSVTNRHAGIAGRPTEGRIAFERRRQQTLSGNAAGTNAAILGALLNLDDVLDAWVTDNASDKPMSLGQMTLPAGNLFICVAGGDDVAIGQVILRKKPPCCPTFGDVEVTVTDDADAYHTHKPRYTFRFSRPEDVAVYVVVTILQNDRIPSDATQQVQQAVLGAARGESGATRMRIGSDVLASQFHSALQALGPWMQIVSITLQTMSKSQTLSPKSPVLTMEVYQMPFLRADTVSLKLESLRHA